MTRRTKIVGTVGPASQAVPVLRQLIDAGLDVVRLNLSHGELDEHLSKLANVRAAEALAGRRVAVLADLPGPKIRSGRFPEGGSMLEPGEKIRLLPGDQASDADTMYVQYDTLLDDLRPGARVVLGDGAISMAVEEVSADGAVARIETGGRANGQPGVNLQSDMLRLTTPTEEDLFLAEAMADAGVEFMAVSFVREAIDMNRVREVVGDRARLVAKIETQASLDNLEAIVAASDAVMVARGDLGIDCPIDEVPHLQKRIIRHCVQVGKPVITATQMLESMISASTPTRAEVSDVANAVFDGTDAVMLSGETAIGHDPIGVISTMSAITERAESETGYRKWADRLLRTAGLGEGVSGEDRIAMALSHAAAQAAIDAGASAILCCTRSGRTARAMARYRPEAALVGLSPDPKMVRTMSLTWGVSAVEVDMYGSTDDMVWHAVETALAHGHIAHGDTVVVLAGAPDDGRSNGAAGSHTIVATDVLRLVRVD
ncbi:MAG: pyruvate kinase [Ilumatobacter sp.]